MILLVGDIQGCAAALDQLLNQAGFSPSRDHVVLLGDLVNRGPDSLGVLQRVARLGAAATSLLGNHDLHLLAVSQGVRQLHKGDTFADILKSTQAESWLEWLRHQKLAHLEAGWLCVHAGVMPQWTTQTTLALAGEMHSVLRGPGWVDFLKNMYGDQPDQWDDGLTGPARHRVIVNTLTRMRFCSAAGQMEFKSKDGAGAAPAGFMPWFDVPQRQTFTQPIAFGHWSTLGLINRPALMALDTGCVWGGTLSAARVDGGRREVLQIGCPQARAPGA